MNAPVHGFEPDADPRHETLSFEESEPTTLLSLVTNVLTIVRRRWLVVAMTMVLAVAGAALAIKMLQPRWQGRTSLLLHMSGPQVMDKVQGVGEDDAERRTDYRDYYETQRQIMSSRAVAERALAELGLAHDPVFLGIDGVESEDERLVLAETIDPVAKLLDRVSVRDQKKSRVVELVAEYPDPDIAAEMANAVADAYLAYVETARSKVGVDAKADIAAEKEQAKQRLEDAERAFEVFEEEHEITSIDQLAEHASQGVLALGGHVSEVEAERIRLETKLAEAKRLRASGNLSAATLLSQGDRELLSGMRRERIEAQRAFAEIDVKYGPKHEEHRKAKRRLELIDGKIEREADELVESLQAQVNAARNAERKLGGSLGREKSQALKVTRLEREYRALEREAIVAADEYLLIARRDTEIAITNRVEEQGIEVLDRATPSTIPVFPRKMIMLAFAAAAGLGLGLVLALAVDHRDQRIRGVRDLERALSPFGLPVLGQLPRLPADTRLGAGNVRAQRRQRDLYAHLFPQSLMAERCRGIRTSLAFSAAGDHLRSIMVTSPSSSEGKSSTAMNLALSFCQANKRVILVDADMRRPRIHQIFPEADEQSEGGVAALLAETCDIDEAVVDAPGDAPDNLAVLPVWEVPDNPAELLETPVFRRMLTELGKRCDLVIVDCPPVLPVTDPMIIARHVDGVVLVGRAGSTRREEMQAAVAQLARGDTNVLGVVLNEVDARNERYNYASEYYTYRAGQSRMAAEPT